MSAVDRVNAVLGSGFRDAWCRIESRGHAPGTGIGLRKTDEVGAFRFGAGDEVHRIGDIFFGLLDRIGDRLHDGDAECHALLQTGYERRRELEMDRRCGQARAWSMAVSTCSGVKFVEARAAAADIALATFEGAGHARQRILHDPDIAAVLNRAARRPRCCESADRPRSPDAWIRRAKQGDRPTSGGGGKMRHRCVGPDIDARPRKQIHHLGPLNLMNRQRRRARRPRDSGVRLRPGRRLRPPRRPRCGKAGGNRAPSILRPFLVSEHWRCVDQSKIAADGDVRRRCGSWANQFRNARDFENVGKAQHLFDAMELVRGRNASVQREAF